MKLLSKSLFLTAFTFLATTVAFGAFAQDDGSDSDVGTKFQPSITLSTEYDDNIYAAESNEESDFITKIAPRVKIGLTNTAPNSLVLDAGLTQAIYGDDSNDNYLNYNAGLKGKYVADDTLSFMGSTGMARSHSRRGDDEFDPTSIAAEPLPLDTYKAEASLIKKAGAFTISPRLGAKKLDYGNVREISGALIDQGFRDRNEYIAGGRVGYDMGNNYELFTDLEYNPRDYRDNSATERSSDGGTYDLGLRYQPDKDSYYEAYAGYLNRNYDKGTVYEDIDALDFGAKAVWTYAEKSKITASVERGINETTDSNVGGVLRTTFKTGISKMLTPELIAKADVRYAIGDFRGGNGATGGASDREDKLFGASAGLDYTLTENISLTGKYEYTTNDSNRDTSDYDKNVVTAGVKFKF